MQDAISILRKSIESIRSHKLQLDAEIKQLDGELKFKRDESILFDLRLKEFEAAILKLEETNVKPKNKKA